MFAIFETVAKWSGRTILVVGLIAWLVLLVRCSYTVERWTQRTAVGKVVGFSGYTTIHKKKERQIRTLVMEFADRNGATRTAVCEQLRERDLVLGDEATVWYSPYSARGGRLTPEVVIGLSPDICDGLLALLPPFALLFLWTLVPMLIRLPANIFDTIQGARSMMKVVQDAKAARG